MQLMKSSLRTPAPFPYSRIWLVGFAAAGLCLTLRAAPFDAAPFGLPLPEGNGVMWEDPREIHRMVVRFADAAPAPERVRLEYWGSRWPEQHLPKDREPGGGSVGWMELGNWYTYKWRVADTEAGADGQALTFTFRPVNAKEFPKLNDYPAPFRYTLKLRVVSEATLPKIERLEAFTDSTLEPRSVNLAWESAPAAKASFEVFNGAFEKLEQTPRGAGGEIQLTDAIEALMQEQDVYAYAFDGVRYDAGTTMGWLEASVELALQRQDIGGQFRQYLRTLDLS